MSPEIDYTRQRTVAELLAEHGDAGGPGRRSRRRGDGPDRPLPPPPAGLPRPVPGGPPVRDSGPPAVPGYRGTPPAPPRPAQPGRRDRPTEMLGDRRPAPSGYGPGPRPAGTDRSTASGPIRAVPTETRGAPGRASASGPMRAVPPAPTGGGSPPNGRAPGSSWGGPPPAPPLPARNGAAAARPAPVASPWEPYHGTPAGGPGRPPVPERVAPAPPRERALREPMGRPFLPASPLPVSHRPAAPVRNAGTQQAGPRPERVPDPGPATGAWNPFEFDDEDDEDGPETVVGAAELRAPARTPRRDAFPTLLDGPATRFDVTGARRGDGPATELDVTARPTRGDGPATDFDVTSFDFTDRSGARGPAVLDDARPPVLRPGPGSRGRPQPAAPAPPRVRPFAADVVDGPTELSDRRLDELEQLDDRTDVAVPSRAPARDVPVEADDEPADDGLDPDVDDRLDDDLDRDLDDDLDDDRELDDDLDDERSDPRPAHAWAGVVAQWLAGAVAGAVLWVLFRFLWRELPVVALAAAVLVTAGLVLLVRQFLHDVDRRTTGFAIAVGLLLTASPAVLVLLGR